MTGIVIAAGRGLRMRPHTEEIPKCMLQVNGRPILHYALERLRAAGCGEIVIVTGHLADRIDAPGCARVRNPDYERNNVLHSLMFARQWMRDDVLITNADILVEPLVYQKLSASTGAITLAVDVDWRGYYAGRTEHPEAEAEKAIVRPIDEECGRLLSIGKHIAPQAGAGLILGEFTGLWKMTRAGAAIFRDRFEALDGALGAAEPFQAAREWRNSYPTDMFSDLMAAGVDIDCVLIRRGWAELDSPQDYARLPQFLESQRLSSLVQT